jgi:short-subunit dehydrogenase
MKEKVLITGASRGIGLAAARLLSNQGYEVTGTSRRPEALSPVPPGIRWIALDLNRPESIEDCLRQAGPVDILINNAGESRLAPAEFDPTDKVRELFETHLFGPMRLIQGVLPAMRENRRGFIMNIGSLAGVFPVPFQSAYSAAKAALAVYTQSLRNEVTKLGVRVVLLSPNDIRTTIEPEVVTGPAADYHDALGRMQEVRAARMAKAADPEIAARRIAAILRKKRPAPAYSVGGGAPLMVFARRLVPDRLAERLVRGTYKI